MRQTIALELGVMMYVLCRACFDGKRASSAGQWGNVRLGNSEGSLRVEVDSKTRTPRPAAMSWLRYCRFRSYFVAVFPGRITCSNIHARMCAVTAIADFDHILLLFSRVGELAPTFTHEYAHIHEECAQAIAGTRKQ